MSRKRSGTAAAASTQAPDLYDPTADDGTAAPSAPTAVAPRLTGGGSVTMYDAGGDAHEVPAAEAPRLLLGGGAFFSKDQTVHVKDERGHVYALPATQAGQAFSAGMQVASEADVRGAVERKEQNTIGKTLEAGAVGAGRGITLGLSDPLAIGAAGAFGGDEAAKATREHLAKLKEFHPVASTVGEVAGAVAPVLLSGGAGAAAEGAEALDGGLSVAGAVRGLGVLPRAAAGAGEAVGGAVRGIVGEGATGLLGRVAQRALPLVAQAGTEGALYGAGGAISEAALGDEELTAEKVLAGAGHGAMLGALTGGALGSAYEIGKAGLDKGLRIAGKQGLQDWLQSVADNQTMRALGANSRDVRNLGGAARSTEQAQTRIGEIADTVRGYRFEDGAKLFRGTSTTSQLADDLNRAADEAGEKLGKFRSKVAELTKTDASLSPDVAGYFKQLDEQVLKPAIAEGGTGARRARLAMDELQSLRARIEPAGLPEGHPLSEVWQAAKEGNEGAMRAIETAKAQDPALAGLIDSKPVSLEELTKARMRIDKILYPPKSYGVLAPPPEHFAELAQARQMLEQTIEDTTEKALSATGNTQLAGSYQDLKSTFRDLSDAKRMASAADMRALARNTASLSDKMAAGSVLAGSLASGGNPLFAMAKSAGAGLINNVVNQRANAMLATAADKAATIVGLGRVAGQTEDKMTHALNAFLSDEHEAAELAEHIGHVTREATKTAVEKREELGPKGIGEAPEPKDMSKEPKTPKGRYEQAIEHVTAMQQPGAAAEHVAKVVEPIATQAPAVASAMVGKVTTAAAYLASQKPAPRLSGYPGLSQKDQPNDVERAAFLRKVDGTNPAKVVAHLRDGRLSHDEMEAFEATSPKLLEQARGQMFEKLAARTASGKPIPYEKIISASTFMGQPLHPTLEPAFIASVQQAHAAKSGHSSQSAESQQFGAPKRKLTSASRFTLPSQRMAQGE